MQIDTVARVALNKYHPITCSLTQSDNAELLGFWELSLQRRKEQCGHFIWALSVSSPRAHGGDRQIILSDYRSFLCSKDTFEDNHSVQIPIQYFEIPQQLTGSTSLRPMELPLFPSPSQEFHSWSVTFLWKTHYKFLLLALALQKYLIFFCLKTVTLYNSSKVMQMLWIKEHFQE